MAKTALQVIHTDSVAQGERKDISYADLFLSPYNVRKTAPTNIEELAATIYAQGGVIENIIVYAEYKDGKPTGRYGVAGGGRRWRAVALLIKAKKFSKNHPMPCLIVPEEKAIELSIVENEHEPMHPADEFEAFRALIDGGKEVKDVAALFNMTENTVYRRLRLANVAPQLIEQFRAGEINLGNLEALALTTDHELQIRVWDSLPSWNRDPRSIRAAIMSDKINLASNPIGRFVGAEAFEKAGGYIERDLFSDKGDGYASDVALLNQLAQEKLEAAALTFRESGEWAWVEVVGLLDYQKSNQYERARMVRSKPTAQQKKRIEELDAQMEAVRAEISKLEEADEDGDVYQTEAYQKLSEKEETLSEASEAAEEELMTVSKEHKKIAGVLVGIDTNGTLKVELGRIRPEDKRAASTSASGEEGEAAQKTKPNHSERLIRQLTAQRTVALQEVVAANHRVALVALATHLFVKTFRVGYNPTCFTISTQAAGLDLNGGEIIRSDRAYVQMNQRCETWEARLNGDGCDSPAEIYTRIAALPETDLYELLALCTARSLDTISGTDNRPALTDLLISETALDMADWWQPTAANYFNHVSKTQTLAVVSSVVAPDALEAMGKMKKGDLAAAAETAMQGQRGLPSEMLVA